MILGSSISPSLKGTLELGQIDNCHPALLPQSPACWVPQSKLEAGMVVAMRHRSEQGTSLRSFDSIILKFPKIDSNFKKCKSIFEEFDEDKNGVLNLEELRHSFGKLEVSFTEEEFTELLHACDINNYMGINFNEFIVLLCLVYLLKCDPTSTHSTPNKPRMDIPNLEATFETLADAFAFLNKNKDGHVSKSEMLAAIHGTTSGERSSG